MRAVLFSTMLAAGLMSAPLHAGGPVRSDDPTRASAPQPAPQARSTSRNAFGQAMADLTRGLRQVRPADAAADARAREPARPSAPAPAEPATPPAAPVIAASDG